MAQDNQIAIVSPPESSGAAPGLGEAFRMNLNTGQGVYSYAISLPDAIAGRKIQLTLEYSHGTRSGTFGFGWQLGVRSISRRLDLGIPGDAPETFLDGNTEITALLDGSFGAINEMVFSRYTRLGDGWKVEDRNGDVWELGTAPGARIADPGQPGNVQTWLLERWLDVSENPCSYTWDTSEGTPYLTEIRYACYAVRFTYEGRPDVRRNGRAGFLCTLSKRCKQIDLILDPGTPSETRIRSWTLTYEASAAAGVSLLAAIQVTSFPTAESDGGAVARPPVRFTYGTFDASDFAVRYYQSAGGSPPALDDPGVALVTLDQGPLPGILEIAGGKQFYWRNTGTGFDYPQALPSAPFGGSIQSAGAAFLDMNGNGRADLTLLAPGSIPGYFENEGQRGWGRFVAYPRNASATPDWRSGRLRFADNDADGRVDAIATIDRGFVLWPNGGELGWGNPFVVPAPADGEGIDFSNPLIQLADMAGHGASDVVEISSGSIRYWPNLGNGRYGNAIYMENSPRVGNLHDDPSRVFLTDIDGDGCADLVFVGNGSVTVYLNRNGSSFAEGAAIEPVPQPIPGTVRAVNLTGTATPGLIWNSYQSASCIGYVHLEFDATSTPYLLASVDNGAGLLSELFYHSAVEDYLRDRNEGALWDTNFPFPLRVLAKMRETDQVTGVVTEIDFRYHNAHYDPNLRRFEGFRTAERIEIGDESRPDTRIVHQFQMAIDRVPGNSVDDAALNGMLAQVDTYSVDGSAQEGQPLCTEKSEHAVHVLTDTVDGRHRTYVTVTSHTALDIERTDDFRGDEKSYTYSPTGNVLREVHRGFGTKGGVAQPEQVRITDVTYAVSTSRRLLDKRAHAIVRDAAGRILAETLFSYDGPDYVGLPAGQADRGLLTRKLQLAWRQADFSAHYDASMDGAAALGFIAGDDADGAAALFVAIERHAYDARGNKTGDMDQVGIRTVYAYDAAGVFRTSVTGPLGIATFQYDRGAAQPNRIMYPGGEVAVMRYDAQGRVVASATPVDDPAQPPRRYSYDDSVIPNVRTVHMLQNKAGNITSVVRTYFDARGKEVRHCAQVDSGTYVLSSLRLYNPWGDLKQEYEPVFVPSPAYSNFPAPGALSRTFFYDGRGRVIRTVNYNGGVSTAEYSPFSALLFDADDNDTSPENSARGQVNTPRREEFDVYRQRSAIVLLLGGGRAMTTTFVTDSLGRTVAIQDDSGTLCTYKLDLLGTRYDFEHRASGHRKLWYDARNRVVRSLDPNGNDLRVTMDAIGRLQRLTSGGAILEEYTYDAGPDALGKMTLITYSGGSQFFEYDAASRITRVTFRYDGVADPFRINYEYDPLGREIARAYSDGIRIERKLTFNGWVSAIPGVLSGVTSDPRGLPVTFSYANGVTTTIGYEPGPGRVNRQRTLGPSGQVYEDITYTLDRMGVLLESADTAPGGRGSAAYTYDPLYQLSSCTISNPNSMVRGYGYSGFLNIAKMDESDSVFAFDDAAHPDQIAGMSVKGGARQDLDYDANGNLLGYGDKTLTYNAKNELTRLTRTDGLVADYGYDPSGRRVFKRVRASDGTTTTTRFAGAEVEIRDGKILHHVLLGSCRVCILADAGPRFCHTDYAGNTSFFTDDTGGKLASIVYRPFGNIDTSSGAIDDRTYGLHPFDSESGLYYMRRRYYSPDLGRFLTPDPLALYQPNKVMENPKALHPYSYAANDPLDNVDYTGLSPWSVLGAIAGVAAGIGLIALVIATGGLAGIALGLVIAIGVVSASYIVASTNAGSGLGDFFRGFMIGFNAGLIAGSAGYLLILGLAIGSLLLVGIGSVGIALGVINFLAAFDSIAGNKVYQGILGWSSWLMPTSWPVIAFGLALFIADLIALPWHSMSVHVNWETGTIVVVGGAVKALGTGTSFDVGTFVFLGSGHEADEAHETGHALGVAAFGSIFHAVGAIEQAFSSDGESYSEHLAESHDPNAKSPASGTWWHMWG